MVSVRGIGKLKLVQTVTLALVFGVIAGIMSLILWYSGASGTGGIAFAIILSLVMVFIQWAIGPWLIRKTTGIKEVSPAQAPELHEIVENLQRMQASQNPRYISPATLPPTPSHSGGRRNPQVLQYMQAS